MVANRNCLTASPPYFSMTRTYVSRCYYGSCIFDAVHFLFEYNTLRLVCVFMQTQYLIQECATLIAKPNFVSILCYALDNPLHQQKVCCFLQRNGLYLSCIKYGMYNVSESNIC